MAVYLQRTSDENLALCISNGLWGASRNYIGNWKPGDQLIVYVKSSLAALFTLSSEYFDDHETVIWPDDQYPYRVRMTLDVVVPFESRVPLTSEQKEALNRVHPNWGTTIVLTHRPLDISVAQLLLSTFDSPTSIESVEIIAPEKSVLVPSTDHQRYQYYLGLLGSALGFSVAIPKGDQTRIAKSFSLSDVSIIDVPRLAGFDDHAQKTITNIDVIWFKQRYPTHLFEVEHTTGITEGILRMSDLIAVVPMLNVEMFICANSSRKREIQDVVARPTFAGNNIGQKCRFLSYQALDKIMSYDRTDLSEFKPTLLQRRSEALTA